MRTDSLGEADFQILLKLNGAPDAEAKKLASAWEGDAYRLEVSEDDAGQYRLVYLSMWATANDAAEASRALRRVFPDAGIRARGKRLAMVRDFRVEPTGQGG